MKTLNSFLMKLGNRQKRAEATPLPAGEDGIRRFPFLFSVTYSDAAEPPALPPAPRARLNRKRSSGLTRDGRRAASSNLPRRSGPYCRAGRPQPETRTRTDGTDLGERAGAAAGKPGRGGEAGALSSAAAAGPLPRAALVGSTAQPPRSVTATAVPGRALGPTPPMLAWTDHRCPPRPVL